MSRMKLMRKMSVFIVMLSLIFSSFSGAFAADSSTDFSGHWAEKELNAWFAQGFLDDFTDGDLKPDQNITRAEFMAFVNRAFGFTELSNVNFSDVPADSSAWYVKEVARAVAAGYITGYQDGTIKPNATITRQEAAAIVARVLKLELVTNDDLLNQFSDVSSFASWSKEAMSAVVTNGIMKGFTDGSFKPYKNITRAEAVVTLDRALHDTYVVYSEPGVFGPATGTDTIEGNVMISVADVTLRNTVIKGDLLLGVGIGDGDVSLNGVTVQGKTIVQGGGENSIHVINSELFTVIVDKQNGTVRIVASGTTSISDVSLQSGAKLEESNIEGEGFGNVTVKITDDGQVVLTGNFKDVQIDVPNVSVSLASGSVEKMSVNEAAQNSNIQLGEGAKVAELTLNAQSNVGGTGAIQKAVVNADGTSIAQKPQEVQVGNGVSADVGGQKVTESTKPTTPPVATTTPPSNDDGGDSGNYEPIVVPVSGITVSPTTMNLSVGGATGTITATVNPSNATNKSVTWSSSNTSVATVANGVVTPIAAGTATITVTSVVDGSKSATTTVTVTSGFTLTATKIEGGDEIVVFDDGEAIPLNNAGPLVDGGNKSIPLMWSGAPSETQYYLLVMYDTHPVADGMIHWLVANIPVEVNSIDENAAPIPGVGTEEIIDYIGPFPPAGHDEENDTHYYEITLFALDEKLLGIDELPIYTFDHLESYLETQLENGDVQILGEVTLTGTYFVEAAEILDLEESQLEVDHVNGTFSVTSEYIVPTGHSLKYAKIAIPFYPGAPLLRPRTGSEPPVFSNGLNIDEVINYDKEVYYIIIYLVEDESNEIVKYFLFGDLS